MRISSRLNASAVALMFASLSRPRIDVEQLPPLPDILSDELRKQVFTHRSVHARPSAIFEDSRDDPSPDNEAYVSPFRGAVTNLIACCRLEHLGDSVLNMVVTSLLQEVYPYLRVGPSTVSAKYNR